MFLRPIALLILLLSAPALAADAPDLPVRGDARITGVAPDGGLRLADGGGLKLAALRLPGEGEPLATEVAAVLSGLAAGRAVVLRGGPDAPDRHGRAVAQAVRDDGLWLQHELLRLGWARLFPDPEDAPVVTVLLAAEREAEAAGRGLWGHPAYAVRNPSRMLDAAGTWAVVRGKVLKAARVADRVYLNFGRDYRTDFTIEIEPADLKAFIAGGVDPLKLAGRRVEVRGLVEDRNGPAIAVTVPIRLRVLD